MRACGSMTPTRTNTCSMIGLTISRTVTKWIPKRRKRSEAGKKGASRRWKKPENGKNGKPMANAMANAWQTDGKPMANAWQDDGKPMANACPVPVPVPDKKEEEYYSSSKEMTLAMFQGSRELAAANSMMRATYPNLDLKNSWDAFATRQYDAIAHGGRLDTPMAWLV